MPGIDANTLLAIHCNTMNLTTDFSDSANIITAIGNTFSDITQSKFGGASARLDGTGDVLVSSSNNYNHGVGPFTWDFWVRVNTGTDLVLLSNRYYAVGESGNFSVVLAVNAATNAAVIDLQTYHGQGANERVYATSSTLSTAIWYHLAIERSDNRIQMYRDGISLVMGASTLTKTIGNGSSPPEYRFGRDAVNSDFNGWVDEIRMSNIVRYNSAFTVEPVAYSKDKTQSLAEIISASEVFTRGFAGSRSFLEPIGLVDVPGSLASTKAFSESISALESFSRQSGKNFSELLSLTEIFSRSHTFNRSFSETVSLLETFVQTYSSATAAIEAVIGSLRMMTGLGR